jgi:thioredoxin-dependent peroxiredoxin
VWLDYLIGYVRVQPTSSTATRSGLASRLGATKRAVIVIDENGVVRHRHDHLLGLDYQSVDDLKRALDELPAVAR